jgi:glyceraldehyde 3-phosphate dehydrogenase
MTINIAINGLGRMGRLALRLGFTSKNVNIVHLNDPKGSAESAAHLLTFDSIHGQWHETISAKNKSIVQINEKDLSWTSEADIKDIPLKALGIDIVIDCTGKNKTMAALQPYFEQGIKKVIVSSPISEPQAINIVYGVNEHLYEPQSHHVISAASCTTNALAPVIKTIHASLGIKHGAITSIHDVTNTQSIIDSFHPDLRRARSNMSSLIPTSTGSAKAIEKIFPELKGKLDSIAIRVPVQNSSLIDCVFELETKTTVDAVNHLLKHASETTLKDILGYEERPLVSVDYVNDPRSAVIDALSTRVINGTQVKLLAWYDNEWGYVSRMIDLVNKVATSLS